MPVKWAVRGVGWRMSSPEAYVWAWRPGQGGVLECQSRPSLCPMDVSTGVQRPYAVWRKPYETGCFRPKIAVFLSEGWAWTNPSGTCSLNCLHMWTVLDIRHNICERRCVSPDALSRRSGQSYWWEKQWKWGIWAPELMEGAKLGDTW